MTHVTCRLTAKNRGISSGTLRSVIEYGLPLPFLHSTLCMYVYNNSNNNSHDNVYGAVIMTKVIARVHPVHLMNVDWAPGGRQFSDQASRLGM